MISKFICEICGEEFDNAYECERHEMEERLNQKAEKVKDEISFWDSEGNEMSLEEALHRGLDHVYTIQLNSDEAVKFFEEESDVEGIVTDGIGGPGLYSWEFLDGNDWVNVIEVQEQVKNFLENVGWGV